MKLTRAASYGVHAVAYLATQDRNQPVASHVIAQVQRIPERFLLKVLKPLVSAGVLYSIKGPNGGYRLAKPPRDVSILDVIEAVDGPIRGNASTTSEERNGALNKRLDAICSQSAEQVRRYLEKVSMAELAAKK
jgi:Rrf2 family protein